MSGSILVAPAGWGKTHFLLTELKTHLLALSKEELFHPKKFIVVPYQEQTRRLKDLLLKELSEPLLFSKTILSYQDLEKLLFPELGGISEIQRKLILEEILDTLPLRYYESARRIPGFVTSLSKFISEWKGLFLKSDDFEKALKIFSQDSLSILKVQDLKSIVLAYQKRTQALGFQDFDDTFHAALLNPERSFKVLEGVESISFDGFYDFLPDQLKLLERLREVVPDVRIYLTHEEGRREVLFDLTLGTIRKLESIGYEKIVPTHLTQNHRTSAKDLQFLGQNLFSEERSVALDPKNIQIFEGVGLRGEITWMAREILRQKRQNKAKMYWSDMAVLFRDIGDYEGYVSEIFSEFKIPYEIHERRKLRENTWVRHLLSGLQMMDENLREPELFFNFLRSSYLRLPKEAVIDFEQFCTSLGFWKEPSQIVDFLQDWLSSFEKKEDASRFIEFIRHLLKQALSFQQSFTLDKFEVFLNQSFNDWGDFTGEALSSLNSQADYRAHHKLKEILLEIKINQESRAQTIDFSAFLKAFVKGIQISLFSFHEAKEDAVQIYSVQMARQKEYTVVFLGGLLQKNFPGILREDPVLKDRERAKLAELGFERRLVRSSHERYYFYLAVTRPTQKLFLSYPRFDLEGKEALPSFFVDEARRLFKKPIRVMREPLSISLPEIENAVTVRDMRNLLVYELGERRSPSILKKKRYEIAHLYNFLLGKKELSQLIMPYESGGKDIELRDGALKEQLRNKDAFSPTTLETYGGCSIRYFFSKVLKLKEDEYYDSPKIEGIFLHELLSEIIEKPLNEAELRLALEEKFKTLEKFRIKPYEKKMILDNYFQIISRFLRKDAERLKDSPFKPHLFEKTASFGLEGSPQKALSVTSGGETFNLIGEMDRVDTNPATQEAMILDYKRGSSRRIHPKEIEEGTHLQLPLYGVALRKLFSLEPVALGIYSIKAAKPSLLERSKVGADAFQSLEHKALDHAGAYVKKIRAGEFKATPKKCPDTCPFPAVCRFEKWRKVYLENEE